MSRCGRVYVALRDGPGPLPSESATAYRCTKTSAGWVCGHCNIGMVGIKTGDTCSHCGAVAHVLMEPRASL